MTRLKSIAQAVWLLAATAIGLAVMGGGMFALWVLCAAQEAVR